MLKRKPVKKVENRLSVALLFEDLIAAKEISSIFKKIGIHPYFYTDLESFWTDSLELRPSLCMIDVSLMSQDNLVLKNHPFIKTEELPVCFYYTDKSSPLLFSTFEIFHLGLIKNATSYAGQIKTILKRFNKMNDLVSKKEELRVSNRLLNRKVERLIVNTEELKEKDAYQQFLMDSLEKISLLRSCSGFEDAIEKFINAFDEVDHYGMMELSYNCQKMVSSECFNSKFKKIPTLWLGKTCRNGIEAFAQALASEVVVELFEGQILSLNIDGVKGSPDKIIYLEINNLDLFEAFDWIALEKSLSSLYNYFENKENRNLILQKDTKNPFELMSFLDSFRFGKYPDGKSGIGFNSEDYLLIDIELKAIVDLALSPISKAGRFYWQEFYSDFMIRLEKESESDFEAIPMGVNHIAIIASKDDAEDFFSLLQAFAKRYPYWRYFEDTDMILSRSMKPTVRMSAFSSAAYQTIFESEEGLGIKEVKTSKDRTYHVPDTFL